MFIFYPCIESKHYFIASNLSQFNLKSNIQVLKSNKLMYEVRSKYNKIKLVFDLNNELQLTIIDLPLLADNDEKFRDRFHEAFSILFFAKNFLLLFVNMVVQSNFFVLSIIQQ